MNIKTQYTGLPVIVIKDGKVSDENFKKIKNG